MDEATVFLHVIEVTAGLPKETRKKT
jgi:hypothetical protein